MTSAPAFGLVLLYVDDTAASTRFYADLLGRSPVEASQNFAMFALAPGMLGLWSRAQAQPAPTAAPGATELDFTVDSAEAVEALHDDWRKRGLTIAQAPTRMDFGHTFVALDPDGHRLRVLAPGGAA